MDAKQGKIIEWLMADGQKGLRKDYRDGKGFQVTSRTMVQPKGKQSISITQALREAGFEDGLEIGGYKIQVQPAEMTEDGRNYPEIFKFFAQKPPVQVEAGLF